MDYPEASELDKRVTFRRRLDVPALGGGVVAEFPDTFDRWAKLVPVGTAAYLSGQQTDVKVTHRVIVRFLEGVGGDFEITLGRQTFRVERAAPLRGGRDFTVFEVEELGHGY
ncbi:head-tail adaptor protein [Bordetella bronchiseptica]|uniref:head-tail adaptor protein n=1 Tax=Bordetella bronchiseptica TaxID=518 RepID=UPI00052944D1|nr:head-tail adaptor protein [Bordetella bronchiseptica]